MQQAQADELLALYKAEMESEENEIASIKENEKDEEPVTETYGTRSA